MKYLLNDFETSWPGTGVVFKEDWAAACKVIIPLMIVNLQLKGVSKEGKNAVKVFF